MAQRNTSTKHKAKRPEIGSHARNAYQGHRSEIIAEFFFSGFGTVVPVPRPADTGIDLYCTLTESAGKKAFSTHLYAVQVKSDAKPFHIESARSMEWFIRHPLPFFFCVVQKREQKILVYNAPFRFSVWTFPPLPNCLTIVPGSGSKMENHHYLGEPFIDAHFADIADERKMAAFRERIILAIQVEDENLMRVRMAIRQFITLMPAQFNDQPTWGVGSFSQTKPSKEHVKDAARAIDIPLSWIAEHLAHYDRLGMFLAILLHNRICGSHELTNQNLSLNRDYGFQDSKRIFAFSDVFLKRLETIIDLEKMKAFLVELDALQ